MLGVTWCLGNSNPLVYQQAIQKIASMINILKTKAIHGKQMTHIINTIMIPKINYRIQLIPIKDKQLDAMDTEKASKAKKLSEI